MRTGERALPRGGLNILPAIVVSNLDPPRRQPEYPRIVYGAFAIVPLRGQL